MIGLPFADYETQSIFMKAIVFHGKKAYKSLQFSCKRVAQLGKLGKYNQKDQYYLGNGEEILGKPKYAIKTSVKL